MTAPRPERMPRLLAARGVSLAAHQQEFGASPEVAARELISMLEAARLTGRGGAGFPAARKFAAIAGDKPVVIGNGAEGEPLSAKDAVLLTQAPHLVLDGLELAANAVGAATGGTGASGAGVGSTGTGACSTTSAGGSAGGGLTVSP